MMSSSSQWETLKKQARGIEQEIENKLVSYSKLGSAGVASSSGVGNGAGSVGFDSASSMELEMDDLLKRVCVPYANQVVMCVCMILKSHLGKGL